MKLHNPRMPHRPGMRKYGSLRKGFALIEATLALSILTVIGVMMLKMTLNILSPRQWMLNQCLADAYMTYERSYAERMPFASVVANDSPWPVQPKVSTQKVEIGRLPGGQVVTGTINRTRIPDANNLPEDGGSGTLTSNPAAMKVWKLQNVLTYEIGGRTYAKARTVIRSQ